MIKDKGRLQILVALSILCLFPCFTTLTYGGDLVWEDDAMTDDDLEDEENYIVVDDDIDNEEESIQIDTTANEDSILIEEVWDDKDLLFASSSEPWVLSEVTKEYTWDTEGEGIYIQTNTIPNPTKTDVIPSVSSCITYHVVNNAVILDSYSGMHPTIQIPSIIDGYPVVAIGDYCFSNASYLKSIELPETITRIGESSFSQDINLESISLSDNISYIGDYAFSLCWKLKRIDLPLKLVTLGDSVFSGCKELESVTISNQLNYIGNSAFCNCLKLQSIIIPDSVKSIGLSCFAGDEALSTVILSNSLSEIPDGTFKKCGVTSIIIPDSVTSIGEYAFSETSHLESVTFGEKISRIGQYAFHKCGAKTVILPDSVSFIGMHAFSDCNKLESIALSTSLAKVDYGAFSFCGSLSSVTIPEGCTTLGYGMFSFCPKIQLISIPSSIKAIPKNLFSNCTGLESVTMADSVISIASEAFSQCSKLNHIELSKELITIDSGVFSSCSNLRSIVIPEKVTKLQGGTFSYCTSLEQVIILNPNCEFDDANNVICYPTQIHGAKGSTAETYAKKYGLLFSEHLFGDWVIDSDATYDSVGNQHRECTICGVIENTEIAKLEHSYSSGWSYDLDEHWHACIDNGYTQIKKDSSAHEYGDWVIDIPATHHSDGSRHNECTICGMTVTEEIPQIPHNWDSGKITKSATTTATGIRTYTCKICGDTKTESIPKLKPVLTAITDRITVSKKPTIKKPEAAKGKITVKWKHFKHTSKKTKKIWKPIKNVQIQCATDSSFKNIVKTATAKKSKTSAKIKGLNKKMTYYVRVRYYDGTGYSAWSKVKKVKTK